MTAPLAPDHRARGVVETLAQRGMNVATAESLTGGLVAATITEVPGASAVFVGSIVTYATRVKADLLGVDADLLARRGAVDPEVARQMAEGVRAVLASDYGVACTGAAGPDAAPGGIAAPPVPAGTAFIAVAGARESCVRSLLIAGDRAAIRSGVVAAALDLLAQVLQDDSP